MVMALEDLPKATAQLLGEALDEAVWHRTPQGGRAVFIRERRKLYHEMMRERFGDERAELLTAERFGPRAE
jgi:hypothetical protein